MAIAHRVKPCLWFDDQAEAAVAFYGSVFDRVEVGSVIRSSNAGPQPEGSVLTMDFSIDGQPFMALNGGPHFTFNEAISLMVECADQAEVDRYWAALTDGGAPGSCGWLKDRFGVSWQIVPRAMLDLLRANDPERSARLMTRMFEMQKLDVAELLAAADG